VVILGLPAGAAKPTTAGTAKERRRQAAEPPVSPRDRLIPIGAFVLVLALAGCAAIGLSWSQDRTDDAVRQRFVARSAQSAGFVSTFTSQLLEREQGVAGQVLTKPDVSAFGQVVGAFGFEAGVLLDSDGALLAIAPAAPALLGTPVGQRYVHLRAALKGTPTVSGVVPSAAKGDPVIAFATPFDTPSGRRVLSGAFLVTETPLRQYLNGMSTLPGFRGFIIDGAGNIVAASGEPEKAVSTLAAEMPAVAASVKNHSSAVDQSDSYDVVTPIKGTPWRLVLSVPNSALLLTAHAHTIEQRFGLGILTLIGLMSCWLGIRLRAERGALRLANRRLADLANRDGLTGLWNRRRLDELLIAEHEHCRNEKQPLSLLLVDVDDFKRVNDTFGHSAGDVVLRATADRIRRSIRDDDIVGRWGGEEFLVLLPLTNPAEAAVIAERVRLAVCSGPLAGDIGGDGVNVTVSIGCYGDATSPTETLVNLADRALYAAKSGGRNRVVAPQQQTAASIS
jgi:diguanylate cyclase (GGDEF)-like protein